MAKITVKINPETGLRTFHVEGVSGTICTDITKALVQANQQVDIKYTEEYVEQQERPQYIEDL